MPRVALAAPGPGFSIGTLTVGDEAALGAGRGAPEFSRPVRVCVDGAKASASDDAGGGEGEGRRWTGRASDVKPGVHWVLVPAPSDGAGGDRGFVLRPAGSWFEFGRPQLPECIKDKERTLAQAEATLLAESGLRAEFERRWEAMMERSVGRSYRQASRSAVLESLRGEDTREDLANKLAVRAKREPALRMLEALEGLEALESGSAVQHLRAALAAAMGDRGQDALLEALRLKDDTGLNWQKRKRQKELKKRVKAAIEAEEQAVPETANALFMLKSQIGEGIWDFDEEEHSDDEEGEKFDFDEQLRDLLVDNQEAVMAEDEDDADAKKREDFISSFGEEIKGLLSKHQQDTVVCATDSAVNVSGLGDAVSDADDAGELSEGEACARDRMRERSAFESSGVARPRSQLVEVPGGSGSKRRAAGGEVVGRRAAKALKAAVADSPSIASQKTVVGGRRIAHPAKQSPASPVPAPGAASLSSSSSACPAGPVVGTSASSSSSSEPVAATPAAAHAPAQGELDTAELRERAVATLRRRGGMCTLSAAAAALGLQQRQTELWRRAITALRAVAEPETVPGQDRPVLLLKLEHWGRSEGPPEATAWCYVAADGRLVERRDDAESYAANTGARRYRVRVRHDDAAPEEVWLPAPKAPDCVPEGQLLRPEVAPAPAPPQ